MKIYQQRYEDGGAHPGIHIEIVGTPDGMYFMWDIYFPCINLEQHKGDIEKLLEGLGIEGYDDKVWVIR